MGSDDATAPHQSRLLQSFLKGHSKAVDNIKRNNMEIAKKMHKQTKAVLETKAENDHLKIQLSNAEQELKELKKTLEGVKRSNTQLNDTYITVLQKYTHCEKHYDEEQSKIKTMINQFESEIAAKQSRNDELQGELKTVQEKYLEMSAQVVAMTQTLEQQRAEFQAMQSQLGEHVKEKTEACNAMQNMEQQLAEQKQLHEIRISELETEMQNQNLAHADLIDRNKLELNEANLNITRIQRQHMEMEQRCCEIRQSNETLTNELEQQRNQLKSAHAEINERSLYLGALKDNLKQAEDARDQLIKSNSDLLRQNEQAAEEFATAKTKIARELKKKTDELEATVSRLKYELQQQNLAYGDLSTRNEQELNDIHVMLSDLQGRLNVSQELCQQKELDLKKLESEHQMKTQILQDELKAEKEKLSGLSKQNQVLVTQFRDDEQKYKDTINTLQAKLEQHDNKMNAHQQQMERLVAERDTLNNNVNQLLGKNEEIANQLATAKTNFERELELQKDILKKKLACLQMELTSKINENSELERKKDGIIAELKFKMNRIGSVFEQPVSSVRVLRPEPILSKTNQNTNPESLSAIESPPAPSRKRLLGKQRIEAISDSSDFLSDNEAPPLSKVKPVNKRGIVGAKRARLIQNEKENNDTFEKLKEGD
ncbi:intracellular protein transport protein USO1 [Drosophila obscura]|uniref:intracellular protein transport protein USO1 n=1 Tax=Drosophila obscura TaxID=7282 RepID=UPI001BB0F643|nr:intracellular protein transport protein USO1 [Drosophila obscura]